MRISPLRHDITPMIYQAQSVGPLSGLVNDLDSGPGAAPMCRGAGGMAATFVSGRARWCVVILGVFFSERRCSYADSIATLFRLFPMPVLGVSLFSPGWSSRRPVPVTLTERATGPAAQEPPPPSATS